MQEMGFEIQGDYIYKNTPILSVSNMYHQEIVMDKQTFIEAYKKWILGEAQWKDTGTKEDNDV